jgi:uncharacterized repeat protein (TIGR01451 family)
MNGHLRRVCLASALLVLLVAGSASAQSRTGVFGAWNSWWVHPTQGTLGVFFDGGAIRIDRDGDGFAESIYVRPASLPDAAIGSLRLTPSRTVLYAFGGSCGSGGTFVYFYRVPDQFNTHFEQIRAALCIANGIDRVGFYDTGLCDEPGGPGLGLDCNPSGVPRLGISPQRIAYFATASTVSGFENFVWVDLVSGTSSSAFDYAKDLGFVHVAPSGTHAFIQHDLGNPGETDYRLVDLCPGTLGQVINTGGFPIADSAVLLGAEVTAVASGTVSIAVGPPGGAATTSFDVVDCLDVPGACCGEFGCVFDGVTATECGSVVGNYTFAGPGTTCSACPAPPPLEACCFDTGTPICANRSNATCLAQGGNPQVGVPFCQQDTCPFADPKIAVDGPASANVGDTISYTLDYVNDGGLTTQEVEIELALPYGTTFVSASDGGVSDADVIRWVIGDLAPGASGSVSGSFTVGCGAVNQSIDLYGYLTYLYSFEGTRLSVLSNPLTLAIGSASAGPISVAVSGTPESVPLVAGDELEHVITLTNTNPDAIPGVRVGLADAFAPTGLAYGTAMSFDRVVDAAGGTVDTSGGDFGWTGDVPAGSSRTIRFVTVLDGCVPPNVDTTSLAFGGSVGAFDQCNQLIGESGQPPSFAIGHLADVSIAATNLGPAVHVHSPIFDMDVQVARPGATADVRVSITGSGGQALPGASVSAFVRGLNVTVPPSAPGASYDPTTREFAWNGTIPASGSVDIDFTGTLTHCRGEIDLDGATQPACLATPDIRAQTTIAAVPAPPGGPWLAGLAQQPGPFLGGSIEDHIVQIDPGPPVQVTTMMCLPVEYSLAMGASPTGDIWVGPLPTYRINPSTLDFQALDFDASVGISPTFVQDVAVDPIDGSVYLAGNTGDPIAKIVRYDPATDLVEDYYEDSNYSAFTQIQVDEEGAVAALAHASLTNLLLRIDPTTPPSASVLYAPTSSLLTDVAIDRDGSYVVLEGFFSATPTVYDVDPDTGALATLVADLRVPFPAGQLWGQIEIDPLGDLYAAPQHPGLGWVQLATPDVGVILRPFGGSFGSFSDLAMVSRPIPEPAPTPLVAALLAVLAGLRARARRSGGMRTEL